MALKAILAAAAAAAIAVGLVLPAPAGDPPEPHSQIATIDLHR